MAEWKKTGNFNNAFLQLLLTGLFFCLLSCGNNNQTHTGTMQISKIEIDVFSGRPNPAWVPTASDQQLLEQHISNTTSISCGPAPDTLGYKGFILTISSHEAAVTQKVRVFAGKIWYTNPEKCFKDSLQLESLLVQQAKSSGFAQLMNDLHL